MKNYKGYEIRKSGEFFEIVNANGKWIRYCCSLNAGSTEEEAAFAFDV